MTSMWADNPEERPGFSVLTSAIKTLMSTEGDNTGYSYAKSDAELELTLQSATAYRHDANPDHELVRQLSCVSGAYVDKQVEPQVERHR